MPPIPKLNDQVRNIITKTPEFDNPNAVILPAQGLLAAARGQAAEASGLAQAAQSTANLGGIAAGFGRELQALGNDLSRSRKAAKDSKAESSRRAQVLRAQELADQAFFKLETDPDVDPDTLADRVDTTLLTVMEDAEAQARASMNGEEFTKFQKEVGEFVVPRLSKLRRSNFSRFQKSETSQAAASTVAAEKTIASASSAEEAVALATQAAAHIQTLAGTTLEPDVAVKLQKSLNDAAESRVIDITLDNIFAKSVAEPGEFANVIAEADEVLTKMGLPEDRKQAVIDARIKQLNRVLSFEDAADRRSDEERKENQEAMGNELIAQALNASANGRFGELASVRDQANSALSNQQVTSSVATKITSLIQRQEDISERRAARAASAARANAFARAKSNPSTVHRLRRQIFTDPASLNPEDIIDFQASGNPLSGQDNLSSSDTRALIRDLQNVQDDNHYSNQREYRQQVERGEQLWKALDSQLKITSENDILRGQLPAQQAQFQEDYNFIIDTIAGADGISNPEVVRERAGEQMDSLINRYSETFKQLAPRKPLITPDQARSQAASIQGGDPALLDKALRAEFARQKRDAEEGNR